MIYAFLTEDSWKLWKKAQSLSSHTHTEVPCSSFPLQYRELKKHLPHKAGQEFPLKYLTAAQKHLLYSSSHCIKSFTLNSKTFLENTELHLNTFFISKWEELYKQFVFHNEEVLYPFQLQTLQTSSLCSGEQYFISQCRINETYHCTEDQKAFLSRQVFTLPEKILLRPQHFNQMPSFLSVIKQSTLKDMGV